MPVSSGLTEQLLVRHMTGVRRLMLTGRIYLVERSNIVYGELFQAISCFFYFLSEKSCDHYRDRARCVCIGVTDDDQARAAILEAQVNAAFGYFSLMGLHP